MNLFVTAGAVVIAFGYAFYIKAILAGNADLTEKSLMAAVADWLAKNGVKSQPKVWFFYYLSLVFEAAYLYCAYRAFDNLAFQILTSAVIGVEAYTFSRLHQRIWQFFHGRITLGDVFIWRAERISALALFTHAMIVLLYPLASRL